MKYKVQEMMIENNAKEEAINKWTAELDEKLEKMEQPMTDIEEAIKNCERRESIEEKNQEKQRFERKIREEKQIEEMRQEFQKSSRIRRVDNNKDAKCKLPKLVISQFNGTHIDYFRFWNKFTNQNNHQLQSHHISKKWLFQKYDYLSMDYPGVLKGMNGQKIYCHQNLENQVNLRMLIFKISYHYQ